MAYLNKILKLLRHPNQYLNRRARFHIIRKFLAKHLPATLFWDKFYMQYTYWLFFKKKLDLRNPKTFNEKLRWIMLYDRNPLYTKLADKYLVREFVTTRIGDYYLNGLIGAYESVGDIDWHILPNQFVIKMAHGSGMNLICKDKANFNIDHAIQKMQTWENWNFYYEHREWHYRNIQPRILVENYLEGDPQYGLLDYRFYCAKGRVKLIQVDVYGNTKHTRTFFDPFWNQLDFRMKYNIPPIRLSKPLQLTEMINISERLTEDLNFCRVDLYNGSERIFFGEMTFTPVAGYAEFIPSNYDTILGNLIDLQGYDHK